MSTDEIPSKARVPRSRLDEIPDDAVQRAERGEEPEQPFNLDDNTISLIRGGDVLPTPRILIDYPEAFDAFITRIKRLKPKERAILAEAVAAYRREINVQAQALGRRRKQDTETVGAHMVAHVLAGSVAGLAVDRAIQTFPLVGIMALVVSLVSALYLFADDESKAKLLRQKYGEMLRTLEKSTQ